MIALIRRRDFSTLAEQFPYDPDVLARIREAAERGTN